MMVAASRSACGEPEALLPVFVYGTLCHGQKNHAAYLAGRYLSRQPATTQGRLYFEPKGGYPFLLPGDGRVRGELYLLAPNTYQDTLFRLDTLEEYDPGDEIHSVYLRRAVAVTPAAGTACQAWAYFWNGPAGAALHLPGGDFSAWLKGG